MNTPPDFRADALIRVDRARGDPLIGDSVPCHPRFRFSASSIAARQRSLSNESLRSKKHNGAQHGPNRVLGQVDGTPPVTTKRGWPAVEEFTRDFRCDPNTSIHPVSSLPSDPRIRRLASATRPGAGAPWSAEGALAGASNGCHRSNAICYHRLPTCLNQDRARSKPRTVPEHATHYRSSDATPTKVLGPASGARG